LARGRVGRAWRLRRLAHAELCSRSRIALATITRHSGLVCHGKPQGAFTAPKPPLPCCCPVMTWTAASPARCMRMAAAAGLYGSSSGAVATRPVGTVKVLAPRVAKPSTTCSDERSQRSAEHVAALDRGGVCKLLADQWWVGQPCHPPRTSPSGCGECSQAIGDGCKRYYEDPKSPYLSP